MKEFVVGESVQSLYDKKKKVVQNVQSYTPIVRLVYFPYTISVITLYNGINFIYMHKLCSHECINFISNGLTFKIIKTNKMLFYFIFNEKCN